MGTTLECHIIKELTAWSRGRLDDSDWDYDSGTYESPFIEFGPKAEISCGQLESLEIHVGNTTEVYFEERRFKPVKLLIVAIPNPAKETWDKNHCNYIDFFTAALYQHPDGTLYSRHKIAAYDRNDAEIPLEVPFAYEVRDLLPVAKANTLLKRNPAVLNEITDRIEALTAMRKKMAGGE